MQPPTPTAPDQARRHWIDALGIAAAGLVAGLPSLLYPFGRDQGEYAAIADAARAGEVIYRDVLNVKPPLTHLVHELAIALFGHSMTSIRGLDLIWQIATAWVVAALTRQVLGSRATAVLAASALLAWHYAFGDWATAQTDGFANLPLSLAMWAALSWRNAAAPWLSGMAIGVAVLFKFPTGALLPLVGLIWMAEDLRAGLNAWIRACLGFCAVVTLAAAAMLVDGSLADFIAIETWYVSAYNFGADGPGWFSSLGLLVPFLRDNPSFLWGGAAVLVETTIAARRGQLRRSAPILAWLCAAAIHLVVQRKFYPYHGLPLIVPMSILGASLAGRGMAQLRARTRLPAQAPAWVLAALLPLGTAHASRALVEDWLSDRNLDRIHRSSRFGAYGRGASSVRANLEVADYLAAHTRPDQRIFIWAFEPSIYFAAKRPHATRFIYNFVLYGATTTPALQLELLLGLDRQPPEYVVVGSHDAVPWVTRVDLDSQGALRLVPGLMPWLRTNYRLEKRIERFGIFRRVAAAPPNG